LERRDSSREKISHSTCRLRPFGIDGNVSLVWCTERCAYMAPRASRSRSRSLWRLRAGYAGAVGMVRGPRRGSTVCLCDASYGRPGGGSDLFGYAPG
jgi:hypothetical protein